jgi:hypothetical protein
MTTPTLRASIYGILQSSLTALRLSASPEQLAEIPAYERAIAQVGATAAGEPAVQFATAGTTEPPETINAALVKALAAIAALPIAWPETTHDILVEAFNQARETAQDALIEAHLAGNAAASEAVHELAGESGTTAATEAGA